MFRGMGERGDVNASVLDGTTCLEASHYLYDSLFILKLTRRNCDSCQGKKEESWWQVGRYRADVSEFSCPDLPCPATRRLLSLLIPRMGFSISNWHPGSNLTAQFVEIFSNIRNEISAWIFGKIKMETERKGGEKRAFERARMRSRTTVNLKTFDDTRLYFRGCFETHCKHVLIFYFLPFPADLHHPLLPVSNDSFRWLVP